MKTLQRVLLACVASVGLATPVWAIDPMDAQSLQTQKVFINESGSALTSGTAVILSLSDADLTTGATKGATSNIGLHITTTTVLSDRNFVGIVHQDSCPNLAPCTVTVYGPEIARFACSTADVTTAGGAIGTSTVSGLVGSGTRAGQLLSRSVTTGNAQDNCLRWVFVNPSPAS